MSHPIPGERTRSLASNPAASINRYRIIDKKELRSLVPYTSHHIARLEAAGQFPRRIQLGRNRVGWLLGDILDWIDARVRERDQKQRGRSNMEE